MCRSFSTSFILTAFQELSGLQQNVHHLLLGPRKSLPVTSKSYFCFCFQQTPSVCCALLLVLVLCLGTCLTCREDAVTPSSVKIYFIQNPATRAWQRTGLHLAAILLFKKKGTGTWYPIILQINNPEVICSPASCC